MKRTSSDPYLQIIYFRPTTPGCTALDGKLVDLVEQHRDHARLVIEHTDESGVVLSGWVSGRSPTVLFVVDGETVAQVIGDVPRFELERLMRSALRAARREVDKALRRSA
jgi:hypothetical protein